MTHFTESEINNHGYELTPDIKANIGVLIDRLSQIREAYGKPMIVTSGLRSQEDQMRINANAPKSTHIQGEAADIQDKDGKLRDFILANMDLMAKIGVWFEDFDSTKGSHPGGGWVHIQSVPPKSGKRVYIP